MVHIAVSDTTLAGDIGGAGISRFHWTRVDLTDPVVADCNTALAAIHGLFTAVTTWLPSDMTWSFDPTTMILDEISGAPVMQITATSTPASVTGSNSNPYGAGLGARINWKTSSVSNRRFMRTATYIVPLGQDGYASNGSVGPTVVTAISAAAAAFLNAMSTGGLELVSYSRPKKGTVVGGHMGPVTGWTVPSTPAGLRSRRS